MARDDESKTLSRKPDDKEPFSALAFKIATDPHVGKLTFIRVYSGELNAGDQVLEHAHGQEGTPGPSA